MRSKPPTAKKFLVSLSQNLVLSRNVSIIKMHALLWHGHVLGGVKKKEGREGRGREGGGGREGEGGRREGRQQQEHQQQYSGLTIQKVEPLGREF